MVTPKPAAFSVVLLSEDSGKDCHQTLQSLVLQMLVLVDPAYRARQVAVEPIDNRKKPAQRSSEPVRKD